MDSLSAIQFCSIIFGKSSLIAAAIVLFLTGACYGNMTFFFVNVDGRDCGTQGTGIYFFPDIGWTRCCTNDCLIRGRLVGEIKRSFVVGEKVGKY